MIFLKLEVYTIYQEYTVEKLLFLNFYLHTTYYYYYRFNNYNPSFMHHTHHLFDFKYAQLNTLQCQSHVSLYQFQFTVYAHVFNTLYAVIFDPPRLAVAGCGHAKIVSLIWKQIMGDLRKTKQHTAQTKLIVI